MFDREPVRMSKRLGTVIREVPVERYVTMSMNPNYDLDENNFAYNESI